jgi:drug/metabolite transporter (DMT)-like permease
MNVGLRIALAAAIIGALIWGARLLDRRWRAKHPDERPFAWGYFQALCFFPAGLLWFITPFLAEARSWQLWLAVIFYGIVGSYAGYSLIREKKKWAWIFVVVAQVNLVTWLIDIHYGGNRWKEFR